MIMSEKEFMLNVEFEFKLGVGEEMDNRLWTLDIVHITTTQIMRQLLSCFLLQGLHSDSQSNNSSIKQRNESVTPMGARAANTHRLQVRRSRISVGEIVPSS